MQRVGSTVTPSTAPPGVRFDSANLARDLKVRNFSLRAWKEQVFS
jgi:hypothetical protein